LIHLPPFVLVFGLLVWLPFPSQIFSQTSANLQITMPEKSTSKDLLAGTAGGIAQVLVGQPFDIVKVVRATRKSPSTLV
jgi:hypothetical protein